ncbi:MAG: DUF1343 domain-containing protein [Tannerellaceae bacterium]|jgi:uncharacterized protein YbbC (DUF1343 family)|nr:DUF1343 domain-containing protein [Tannerellaceae bacterium]
MKTIVLLAAWLLVSLTAWSQPAGEPVLGAERMDVLLGLVKDKRVGLAVNHTSVLGQARTHLLDTLLSRGVRVKKVLAPEHGFRGVADAGQEIKDSRDGKTGVAVLSVYGKNRKPAPAQLEGLDVVVFDIQDVGARYYTYISTLHYIMEACAENGVDFIVLDRPNPNDFVDGPVRRKGFESFVGVDPLPILYGLTPGELAQMINGEGWLKNRVACNLRVVTLLHWKHGDAYRLPVKPSPNLPNHQSVRLFPSLCFFEATAFSIGRGTYFPFQVIGYPHPQYGTFTFTPQSLPGFETNPLQKGKRCYGADLREYPFKGGLSLQFLLDFYKKAGSDPAFFFARPQWFDLLAGTDRLRRQITQGMSEADIRATWRQELTEYKAMRKKYLLYPDYQ